MSDNAAHRWAVLNRAHLGHEAGAEVKLASFAEKERMVAEGIAADCPDPEAELVQSAVAQAVAEATAAFDQKLDAIAKAADGPAAKLFAVPRDRERESLNGFAAAGDFWKAVAHAGTPGKRIDNRLLGKAPLGLHSGSGPDGGFLVPRAISDQILEIVFAEGNLLPRTDTQAIAGNSIVLKATDDSSRATGARRGGVRGYWLSEAEQHVASKPKFREVTLKPHKLGVFYYATDEELSDSGGTALERKLAQYAAEEIDWLVGEAILAGDGVGKPLGILNSAATISVAKEAGQAADTIVFPNLVKMYSRMLPRSLARAAWLINADCLPQLMALAFPGAGGTSPAFVAGSSFPSLASAPYGTLLGRPILVTEHNPTLGDFGDILFADLSMYKTATRGQAEAAMSIHVRFDYGETAFRFDFRIDGQPWLQSPVTPAKGTATLSPFVGLQAR